MLFSPGMASFLMVGAPVATLLVLLAVVLPLIVPELRRARHAHDAEAAPDTSDASDPVSETDRD